MRNDFETGYLEHSALGTTWKKKGAKYLSRVWKNGKWVYEYKITGNGYLRDAKNYQKRLSNTGKAANKAVQTNDKNLYKAVQKQSNYYVDKQMAAEDNYRTKSFSGIADSVIESGKSAIDSILDALKPQETITISSNLYPAGTKKVIKKK